MAPIGFVYANTFSRSHFGVRVYETVIPRTFATKRSPEFRENDSRIRFEWHSGLIALSHKNSSSGRIQRPLLATKREDESRKTAEDSLFFKFHSVFLGDATRWDVVEVN
jgi:hypothetical protein